ncbi:MAG TPA: NAD(P)H-dependent oxidoreductase [Solirubrobacteraceae bacterium]|nr:NAD(P)H-dependent oxidoreductase [Solirubrobacteraceae bacterium]
MTAIVSSAGTPRPVRRVVALVGNLRTPSRTHRVADSVARVLSAGDHDVVDLAALGSQVLEPGDPEVADALNTVTRADVLVVATPTYKGTYTGLLKAFLDRLGPDALAGVDAVPVMLAAAPDHKLAVDVHLTPLLLELGASVPNRGLFVLEADVERADELARAWAA